MRPAMAPVSGIVAALVLVVVIVRLILISPYRLLCSGGLNSPRHGRARDLVALCVAYQRIGVSHWLPEHYDSHVLPCHVSTTGWRCATVST